MEGAHASSNGQYVVETSGLTKNYGEFAAVDGLDLRIKYGEVFGILGPNGSGKTTTILMLLGLTEPTAGSAQVLGEDPVRSPIEVKARVGYLPEQVGFYDNLTARQNLTYIAHLNDIPRDRREDLIEDALDRMGLDEDVWDMPVQTYSRGMRQRLGLAEVIMKKPEVVILDEPTLGLDPTGAQELLKEIATLKDEGITVLMCSHLLHQVQSSCDRVGLFSDGRMVLEGTVRELADHVLGGSYRILVDAKECNLTALFADHPKVIGISDAKEGRFAIETNEDIRSEIAQKILEAGGKLLSLDFELPSLDLVYQEYFRKEGELDVERDDESGSSGELGSTEEA